MRRSPIYTVLAVAVLFLTVVPLGTSVFILGFLHGDSPCILCWAQRIGMALVALVGLFVLRYGPRPFYLGLGVLVSAWGVYMGIRHSSLHLARDVGQGFALEMLGAHTYVWSFAVFWVCIVVMALLIMRVPPDDLQAGPPRPLGGIDRIAVLAFIVVSAGTIVQAFASTGPPPYVGQADPVRFSFNPRHWVWSLDEYSAAPVSLRGRWAIGKPDITSVNADPAAGPLPNLPALGIVERRPLGLNLRGTPTGLAYDSGSDRFLLTTESGIYLTDGTLGAVRRYTVVDPLFSVDLGRFAGAAFLPGGRLLAVSENKSYVVLRETDTTDVSRNYRFFLESLDAFEELARSRFSTVRARMLYVMSAAFDPSTGSVITVTVPNARAARLIVSAFDAADMQLSQEFLPRLDPSVRAAAAQGVNPLDAYYVTATTVADGRLLAISAAYSTLLTVDLASRAVVAAHVIPGLSEPTGLAAKNGRLHIVTRGGELLIVDAPAAATGR